MDVGATDLCRILTQRLHAMQTDPMRCEQEFQSTLDKLNAVLNGDWLAFHQAAEREIHARDEQIMKEQASQEYMAIGMQRLRIRSLENQSKIESLVQDLAALRAQMNYESGISFLLPFDEVKRHLTCIGCYPDSIVDPEETQAMQEYGWRRKLQLYVDKEGKLPS